MSTTSGHVKVQMQGENNSAVETKEMDAKQNKTRANFRNLVKRKYVLTVETAIESLEFELKTEENQKFDTKNLKTKKYRLLKMELKSKKRSLTSWYFIGFSNLNVQEWLKSNFKIKTDLSATLSLLSIRTMDDLGNINNEGFET